MQRRLAQPVTQRQRHHQRGPDNYAQRLGPAHAAAFNPHPGTGTVDREQPSRSSPQSQPEPITSKLEGTCGWGYL